MYTPEKNPYVCIGACVPLRCSQVYLNAACDHGMFMEGQLLDMYAYLLSLQISMSVALTMVGVHTNASIHSSLTSVPVLTTWSWELTARIVLVSMIIIYGTLLIIFGASVTCS